jgi:hypothetical protein
VIICAFLGKNLASIGWEIWYQLDQKRIEQEKCVNKDRPAMKCNGKCYLAKQLKKLEEAEAKKNNTKRSNPFTVLRDVQLSYERISYPSLFLSKEVKEVQNVFSRYTADLLRGSHSDIFHPPCLA